MASSKGVEDQVKLSDDLPPEQLQRLRAAVRLVVNYLLDSHHSNCQNEMEKDVERINATTANVVQLRLEL